MTGDGGAYSTDLQQLRQATAILGKKWHPLVVQTLRAEGPLGFNALKSRIDGISDKVLSETLDDLENAGLIVREIVDDKPVRVSYSLKAAGRDLNPVIESLVAWSREHLTDKE
jgi:DNA-binding HxlR family transcriptional regulator